MNVLQTLREGGWAAFGAAGLGGLATLVGAVALMALAAKSRTTLALGVVTLGLTALTATAGVLGTLLGRAQVREVLAAVSPVDAERILHAGYREAASAALVGFVAALAPLLLGAVAALAGARRKETPTRVLGEPQGPADRAGAGRAVVAVVFLGVAGLAVASAIALWRAPLPVGRSGFAEDDLAAWTLAGAVEQVETTHASPSSCLALEAALRPFVGADATDTAPAQVDWRPSADACVRQYMKGFEIGPGDDTTWKKEGLLASPLVHSEALRRELEAWQRPGADEGTAGAGHRDGEVEAPAPTLAGRLSKEVIQRVVRAHLGQVRYCYEKSLLHQPTLAGKVVVRFTVDAGGAVTEVTDVSEPPFPAAEVPGCIASHLKRWRFPKPEGGGVVVVTYPFILEPAAP
ncbi:MAG: AgmX/PglI C-terminal domain-containing protein [Myxococcota bacterium]|jgi:hypothetical protein